MSRSRLGARLALALLLAPGLAAAQKPTAASWVGKRVITRFGTDLKVKNTEYTSDNERRESRAVGGQRRAARVYKVAEADGNLVRLVSERDGLGGWAKPADLIPFEKAEDYYSAEIKRRGAPVADLLDARGTIRFEKGDYDRALADFDEAIRLEPRNEIALTNRGMLHLTRKAHDRALADFDEAIRLDPNYGLAHNNRGLAHQAQGELDQALADFTEAIRLDPNMPRGHNNRGLAHHARRDLDRALADFTEAIRLNPGDAAIRNNRAIVRAAKGDYREALDDLDEAIRLDPGFAWAHNNRAWIRATCPVSSYRDAKIAVDSAATACRLTGEKDPEQLGTLAAAHAEARDFPGAVSWQEKALALLPAGHDRREFERRLGLYRAGTPYQPPR